MRTAQYLYGSEPSELSIHNVTEVLYAAEKYCLDGLKQYCLQVRAPLNDTHSGSLGVCLRVSRAHVACSLFPMQTRSHLPKACEANAGPLAC